MTVRTLISNGLVHSGERFAGVCDLLIEDDKIAEIGDLKGIEASEVVDASGCVVCPGFIDVQNMTYEVEQLDCNGAENLVTQGVTSCIIGNCGNSGVLGSPDSFLRRMDYLNRASLGVNVGMLVGHNSLRRFVLTSGERVATPDERRLMTSILAEALDHGAMGMSSGLVYSPGLFADKEELIDLVSVVGQRNKVYATHMRDEGDSVLEAIAEALETARVGSAKLVIAHFKINGKGNWGKWADAVRLFEQGRQQQDFHLDFYPYTATSTFLSIILLPEILQAIEGDLSRLRYRPADERLIEAQGKQNLTLNAWRDVVLVSATDSQIIGKSIASLAVDGSCYEAVVEVLRQDPKARAVFHNIAAEEQIFDTARLPYAMVATDGYVYPAGSKEATHPRNYGAFPRVLHEYVLRKSLYSLDEFIQKSTQLPASVFGVKQRGMLRRGYFADVIVFRPDEVRDHAVYEHPFLTAEGMQHVFVNGKPALKKRLLTQELPGRLIS